MSIDLSGYPIGSPPEADGPCVVSLYSYLLPGYGQIDLDVELDCVDDPNTVAADICLSGRPETSLLRGLERDEIMAITRKAVEKANEVDV